MCVIVVCDDRYPTKEELKLFEDSNKDGAGVAWREGGKVRFVKGVDADALDRMRPYLATRLPVVMHFRIATVGDKIPQLCHPFPMDGPQPREVLGGLADRVLFHNGTWSEWYAYFADNLDLDPYKWKHVIRGDWSDSRFMAGLLADQPEFIEARRTGLEDQRIVLMDKDEVACYGKWETYKGLRVSNTWFLKTWDYTPAKSKYGVRWAGWRDWTDEDQTAWEAAFDKEAAEEAEAAAQFEADSALGLEDELVIAHGTVMFEDGQQWMYDADMECWMALGNLKISTP